MITRGNCLRVCSDRPIIAGRFIGVSLSEPHTDIIADGRGCWYILLTYRLIVLEFLEGFFG